MYDYKISVCHYLEDAYRQFSLAHNIADLAKSVGMQAATLRNKVNPEQPHQLTLIEFLAIADHTEDPTILDGVLRQLNCQPSVSVNNATPENMQSCALTAMSSVGVIAGEAVSTEKMTVARRNQILDRASDAIRSLSLLVYSVESRFQTMPALAAAVDVVSSAMPSIVA